MKISVFITIVALSILVLSGCAAEAIVEEDHRLRIGFAQSGNPNPWQIALTESMESESDQQDVNYFYTDANNKVATHVANINNMLEDNLDYLVVAPIESIGLKEVLEKAESLGVPVILTGRTTEGPYVTTVYSDQAWEGERCAEIIGAYNPKAKVLEIRGIEGTSSVEGRASGFRKILNEQYPDVEIIAEKTGNFSMTEAMELMDEALKEFGSNRIDAVYAHNDNMALGAIQSIKEAGLITGVDIVVIGIDGQKEALDAIIAGEMMASVQCSPKIGEHIFEVIRKLENGESLKKETIVPDIIFDESNAKDLYEFSF